MSDLFLVSPLRRAPFLDGDALLRFVPLDVEPHEKVELVSNATVLEQFVTLRDDERGGIIIKLLLKSRV